MTWRDVLARAESAWPGRAWTDVLPALFAGLLTILLLRMGLPGPPRPGPRPDAPDVVPSAAG